MARSWIKDIGAFSYQRDSAGRLRQVINHKGETFAFKYDLNQRLKEVSSPVSITSFSFDTTGFNTQIEHKKKSGALIDRFIQGDIDPGKLKDPSSFNSKCAYVLNNPLIYNDSEGKSANLSIGNTIDISFGFSQGTNVRLHPVYGSYCGPYSNDGKDFSAPAKDGPDSVCKNHDQNYAGAENYRSKHWNSGNFFAPELATVSETGHCCDGDSWSFYI